MVALVWKSTLLSAARPPGAEVIAPPSILVPHDADAPVKRKIHNQQHRL